MSELARLQCWQADDPRRSFAVEAGGPGWSVTLRDERGRETSGGGLTPLPIGGVVARLLDLLAHWAERDRAEGEGT